MLLGCSLRLIHSYGVARVFGVVVNMFLCDFTHVLSDSTLL